MNIRCCLINHIFCPSKPNVYNRIGVCWIVKVLYCIKLVFFDRKYKKGQQKVESTIDWINTRFSFILIHIESNNTWKTSISFETIFAEYLKTASSVKYKASFHTITKNQGQRITSFILLYPIIHSLNNFAMKYVTFWSTRWQEIDN